MSALDNQIGGEHYAGRKIQPAQYIEANSLGFLEGCVVKRLTRHNHPTGKGRQDIEKAIHELQLLLELRYGAEPAPARAPGIDPSAPSWATHRGEMPFGVMWLREIKPGHYADGVEALGEKEALRDVNFLEVVKI